MSNIHVRPLAAIAAASAVLAGGFATAAPAFGVPGTTLRWQGEDFVVQEGVITAAKSQAFNHRSNVVTQADGDLVILTKRHCYEGGLDAYSADFVAARDAGQVLPLPSANKKPCGTEAETFYSSGRIERVGHIDPTDNNFTVAFTGRMPDTSKPGARQAFWVKNDAPGQETPVEMEKYNFCTNSQDKSEYFGELDLLEWYSKTPRESHSTTHMTCGLEGDPYLTKRSIIPITPGAKYTWTVRREGKKVTYGVRNGAGGTVDTQTHTCGKTGELHEVTSCNEILNADWRLIIQGEVFRADPGKDRLNGPDDKVNFPTQRFVLSSMTIKP